MGSSAVPAGSIAARESTRLRRMWILFSCLASSRWSRAFSSWSLMILACSTCDGGVGRRGGGARIGNGSWTMDGERGSGSGLLKVGGRDGKGNSTWALGGTAVAFLLSVGVSAARTVLSGAVGPRGLGVGSLEVGGHDVVRVGRGRVARSNGRRFDSMRRSRVDEGFRMGAICCRLGFT